MKLSLFLFLLVLISCKTYTISKESFKKQFVESDGNSLKKVEINNPLLLDLRNIKYLANNIKVLEVVDNKGNIFPMPNQPSVEMRVTHKNGKKYLFYFDTVVLKNDTLEGARSRFLNLTRKVPFDSIVKIEIQDSKKGLRYENEDKSLNPNQHLLAESNPKASKILENSHRIFDERGEQSSSITIFLDSVEVEVARYRNINYATCLFQKSKTRLNILYTIENNVPIKITTREYSQVDEKTWWINDFYLENKTFFFEEQWISEREPLKGTKQEKYDTFKFNKKLNAAFLKKLAFEVYDKSKNKP